VRYRDLIFYRQKALRRDILTLMRKPLLVVTAICAFSGLAGAQDDMEYQNWMKAIQPAMRAIRGTDEAAAKEQATKLADVFDKVSAYWKAKHADDAVKLADTARDAAKAIASGSGDKAANMQAIQGTCMACHSVHRDGAAPNWKIK
jgi:hypothetical protein